MKKKQKKLTATQIIDRAMSTQKKQKAAEASRKREANARRQVNAEWERMSKTRKYRQASNKQMCTSVSLKIENEVMDGILLNLNERNNSKSHNVQMRLLRRIVEKRQAQANHRKNGRSENLWSAHLTITCTSTCMNQIRRKQLAC